MTKDDLIAMAREAGMTGGTQLIAGRCELEAFAKLIEARTREECAALNVTPLGIWASDAPASVIEKYRAAIRAMGERT